jgi:hypothetical protein
MAHRGRKLIFHGAYKSKAAAVRKERRTPGAFIVKRKIEGHTREIVFTKRKR